MSSLPNWLPPLIKLEDSCGNWEKYVEKVFSLFYEDFISSQPKFQNLWVRCRRDLIDGKEAGFWHCISDGPNEHDRIPDLRRCERIFWICAIIENSQEEEVDCWPNYRYGEERWLLWLNEEFLIVLAKRIRKRNNFRYFQLITAYCTDEKHRKEKLRKERDGYYKSINS